MKTQIRDLIAQALHSTSHYDLAARCEHYGLEPGKEIEAVASKKQYVLRRLEKLSDQEVLRVANLILADLADDTLQSAVEQLSGQQLVSDITRRRMAEALNGVLLTGTADPHDFGLKHWPDRWNAPNVFAIASKGFLISKETLNLLGFFDCSQTKMVGFIEDLVNPSYREEDEQKAIVEKLDPLLRLDGFTLAESGRVSGCPIYRIQQIARAGSHPADELVSVRDTGFSAEGTMSEKDEWISAASAVALLGESALCKRAHAGLIKARANRFIRNGQAADNVDVPAEFWWAAEGAALSKNWTTGDFDTRIESGDTRLQAFGVTFRRSEVEQSKPPVARGAPSPASMPTKAKVFIGHGRSSIWRELKDFLKDRLHLTIEEFNSVPTAGIPTADRLEEMLGVAAFAFLIFTAEDEQVDGKFNPRLNVIHEAGLFQGRLGFKRAIILLEEGCEQFSNIDGLGQIRFPKGNISAKYEEVRQVLERESLIAPR